MQPLISVIVPIYNAEAYLQECIRSVLTQTCSSFELLLIDDGSTDGSKSLCEHFAETDSRIRYLRRPHAGVSAARNAGITASRGKYLFFLDSDDVIHPCLLETLSSLLEKKHAIAANELFAHTEKTQSLQQLWHSAEQEIKESEFTHFTNQEALDCFIRERPLLELGGIGGYMILKSAVQSTVFNETLSNGEDTLFIYHMFSTGADMIILKQSWYGYRIHARQCTKNQPDKAQQSLYSCHTCIRDSELAAGRTENAVMREGKLVNLLALWYAESKKSHNKNHTRLLWNLIKTEKKWPYFRQIPFHSKVSLFLACHILPLYWVVHYSWAFIEDRFLRAASSPGLSARPEKFSEPSSGRTGSKS